MTPGKAFLAALASLWLRLSTVAAVALLFLLTLQLPGRLGGSSYYLSAAEVAFEIAVYAVFVALAGVALGAFCAAAVAPILFYNWSSRLRIVQCATDFAVATAVFVDLAMALNVILEWAQVWGKLKAAIYVCYLIAFVLALCIPRRRKQLVTSLDGYLGETATRRTVIGIGMAAATLVVAETAMGKIATAAGMPRRISPPSGPNILLITFDALSAEDMSLYGRRLPTTPHIDGFARRGSVFTNYYSGSTFTTPSVTTMLTGLPLSEHHVYALHGHLRGAAAGQTLPHLMRAAGYSTAASISNPAAYFLNEGIAADYGELPDPAYATDGMMKFWDATRALHQHQPFGSRILEFRSLEGAWDFLPSAAEKFDPHHFSRTRSDFPPAKSFDQARGILEKMPDGFFLWVHVYAPHSPYLPSSNLGRFLPSDAMRTGKQQELGVQNERYGPSQQGLIDQARLRYDEFLADADSAFGSFLSQVEKAGRLRNTAVIVSADHGESFEGGIYGHDSRYQNRPQIHIPLIIRTPGQERGSRVAFSADQTSLAPTILEIAGVSCGEWMQGESLGPWLNRNGEGEGQGLAFTQYLATNSVFKPITHGTVGVIDGRHQYILDLDTGKGILRGLDDAQSWNFDCSPDDPALAQTLRETIYARFPNLPRRPA